MNGSTNRLRTAFANLEDQEKKQFISNIVDALHVSDELYHIICDKILHTKTSRRDRQGVNVTHQFLKHIS
jgi:hypothetical protein